MTSAPVLLFLNVGRRVELVRNFRESFQHLGLPGRIVTTDINKMAPAFHMGDSQYILPRCSDSSFLELFIDLCHREHVDLVIPLIDPDLSALSEKRDAIESSGIRLLLSDSRAIKICGNKLRTKKFLDANGFPNPRIIKIKDGTNDEYPLFIKPADGSASVDAYKLNNDSEFDFFTEYIRNPIVQEFIDGTEVTVDVFSDWDGEAFAAVPRRRLKIRAGEVSAGKIERNDALESMTKEIASALGTVCPLNIQAFTSGETINIIEINPRFGGGCPLSMAGGLPLAKWVTQMALGQPLKRGPVYIDDGLCMLRFDEATYLHLSE